MERSRRLASKETILIACTLFGMFFGAGNLIFPVHLGQMCGSSLFAAAAGFIITGVGIPILGVAAIGMSRSDGLEDLASRAGKGYGKAMTALLYLTIGPLFAIPRCATTSFTTGIEGILPGGANSSVWLLVFSAAFFAVVLICSLKPEGITTWIGKLINPLFLAFYLLLVVVSLIQGGADVSSVAPQGTYADKAFFNGLIEGYGTMDALAGLAFGIIVVNEVRRRGVTDDAGTARDVLRSGIGAGLGMAAIYAVSILLGVRSRAFFETSENGGIALAQIARHSLGGAGSVVLALAITFACLKTAAALVTACSEAFVKLFPRGPKYRVWAVCFTLFSFVISNVGLTSLIQASLPVLMFLYPQAIALTALGLSEKLFRKDRRVYVSVCAFTAAAALFDLIKALPDGARAFLHLDGAVSFAQKVLPLYDLGLGWVIPAALGFAVGIVLMKTTGKKKA